MGTWAELCKYYLSETCIDLGKSVVIQSIWTICLKYKYMAETLTLTLTWSKQLVVHSDKKLGGGGRDGFGGGGGCLLLTLSRFILGMVITFLEILGSVGWNYLSVPKIQLLHHWCLWMHNEFHPSLNNEFNYLSILELSKDHVSKRDPGQCNLGEEIMFYFTIIILCPDILVSLGDWKSFVLVTSLVLRNRTINW